MPAEPSPEVVDSAAVVDAIPAMFPGAARVGDDLLASFSTVADGWPGGQIGLTRSTDDGRSWSPPVIVAQPDGDADAYVNAVGMTTLADGRVLLPYNAVRWTPGAGVAGRRMELRLLVSDDGGHSWTRDAVAADFFGPCVYGSMIEIDGSLLWPIWGQRGPGERWRSALLRSRDRGRHWAVGATIGYDPEARLVSSYAAPAVNGLDADGRPRIELTREPDFRPHSPIDGFSETSVAVVHDGSLLAVLRQQGVGGDDELALHESRSTDGGHSWSDPVPMAISGMSPLLYRAGDRLLLGARRRYPNADGGGPGVEVRMSSSAGVGWSEPVRLVDPHGVGYSSEYQCGYPAMAQLDPDHVLVLFYSCTGTGQRYLAANVIKS